MTSDRHRPTLRVRARPLTARTFAPFGQVLEPGVGQTRLIRDDAVRLTHVPPCLPHSDTAPHARVDLYQVTADTFPVTCQRIEHHPLSAQMFVPMSPARWLVAVWPEGPTGSVEAFVATPDQAIVYKRGIWHQGIVAIDADMQFLSMMFRGTDTKDTAFSDLPQSVTFEGSVG